MTRPRPARSGKALPIILGDLVCVIGGIVVGMSVSGRAQTDDTDQDVTQSGDAPSTTPADVDANTVRVADGGEGDSTAELPPPIIFDPPQIDMGVLRPGEVKSESTLIKNTSDQPIEIEFTQPTCTCTSVDLARTVIPPGESVPLKATFDARQTLGPKTAAVFVGIKGFDRTTVDVVAEVTLSVRTTPAYLRAFKEPMGEFTLDSLDGEPFSVLSYGNVPLEFIDFDPESDDPRNSYRVAWDLTGFDAISCLDADGERMPGWLYIETDHPGAPILDVIIRHECTKPDGLQRRRPWHLNERRMLLGALEYGKPRDIEVQMKWLRNAVANDRIRRVTTTSDAIEVELLDVRPGRTEVDATVRITPKPGYVGPFYAEMQVNATSDVAMMVLIGKVSE